MATNEEPQATDAQVPDRRHSLSRWWQRQGWSERIRLIEWPDVALAFGLALVALLLSLRGSGALGRETYTVADLWFDADLLNRAIVMLDRLAGQHLSNSDHPLFSLVAYLPTSLFRSVFGMDPWQSVRTTVAIVCAMWASALYVLMRLLLRRRLDAMLYSLLGIASGSATFWFGVPESFLFGSATMLVAGCLVLLMARKSSVTGMVVVSALTLSMSVSNWILGLAAAFFGLPWRRALQVSINGFFGVTLIWGLSKWFLFPSQEYFLGSSEIAHVAGAQAADDSFHQVHIGPALRSFVFHSMVVPEIGLREGPPDYPPEWAGLSLIDASPGSGTVWGIAACFLWIPILLLGINGLIGSAREEHGVFPEALMLTIGGTLALHLIFGAETFLYSMHFAPLLVVLAAFGARSAFRRPALLLALGLLVTVTVNNQTQFGRAVEMAREIVRERPRLVRDHVEDDPPSTVVEFLGGSWATPWLSSSGSM
jgi:hypothetical protein